MPRLLSVNVGLPRDVTWNGKTVRTSVWKSPVDGRRMVRKLDIDGYAQADLAGHGGERRAIFVYQTDSCHYWERFLGRNDFTFGQFGSIIYNPEPLERPAPGNVLVCCSQPNEGVTLDL
jgi:MOSC domain-containing protein YiiM